MTDEQAALVLKLLVRNIHATDVAFGVLNDYACLIEELLPRCCHTRCADPATVKHSALGVQMCDAHAAQAICKAIENLNTDYRDDLNVFRTFVANDELWVDVPNAVRIRRLIDYVSMLKKNDEPDPPEDFDQLH